MRILVTGSRDWGDPQVIAIALLEAAPWPVRGIVVHGGAVGADSQAGSLAYALRWDVEVYRPNWQINGKRAGLIRNQLMVSLGADICLAFIRNGSRGASHCAALAEGAGIPTRRYTA